MCVCVCVILCGLWLQRELVEIRELVDRGDNVQRLGRKLAGIKRKRVGTHFLRELLCIYKKYTHKL